MDLQFIRDRISVLRTKKNVSEYRMSTDLGHSKSYMQSISSGRSVPSLGEFLYICEYLYISIYVSFCYIYSFTVLFIFHISDIIEYLAFSF